MDRELEQSVKNLERGVEVRDMQQMRGAAMAQTLTGVLESGDVDAEIDSLRKKLRNARIQLAVFVILTAGVIVARLLL